ncbi:hypothetical protein BKA62DRAFT_378127 [Auriculariales sp. MPI-PUGE-AT-0066]|nr:hypothetical protein BKA62DRAFT_378127 [Auriculariales sp. MPI-PUGE-AT-0066]
MLCCWSPCTFTNPDTVLAMDRAKIIDVDLSEHELTDRMLRHLLRDLDDKVARDLSSRIQPVISHFRSQIAHLSSHAKHAKSQSSIPTAVRLQRFCEAVGRAGLARGITSSLEDVLRGQIDTVSPAFMFHLPDAPAPIAAPPPVPVKSAPLSPIRPTKPQSPPRTPVPGPSRTPMVWDWDRDVSPPRLVQVPFRRKDSSRSSSHGSHNSRPDSPSSRSRLRREPSPTPVASRVLHVRPPSVASMRPTRAHSPPVPRYMTPFGDLDEDVDTEQAITREDVIRRLQSARTDELPDEFNTKDVAREIMLEHIQQWEQPVLAYLDAVREKIMRDVGDLLSEHFGALVGMRLGVSKLVRARVTEATYYARAQLCQLLKTEQQPSVGDKTVYLALVHKHRHAVRDALQGANVEALPHEAMEQAAAEDVVARVMAYFEGKLFNLKLTVLS